MTNFCSRSLISFFLVNACLLGSASLASDESSQWRTLTYVQNAIGVSHYEWDGDSICFSNNQNIVRFYPGRRKSDVNGTTLWLNAVPDGSVVNNTWRLAGIDLDFLQIAVLPHEEGNLRPLRVLLDPGHGGDDEGASSKNPVVKEKDLTLTLSKKIGSRLKKAGLQVDYTRTHDATLSLADRSMIARQKKADLFISIHANHASNREACGIETYILPPCGYPGTADGSHARGWQIGNRNDYNNTLLGFSVHQKLSALSDVVDRGLKRQSFFVLRETSCPAVLIECGFLSNTCENHRMLKTAWQEHCATAITDGVLSYARKVDLLDKAVADKRVRDSEANKRWRQYLASLSAHSSNAQLVASAKVADNRRDAQPAPASQRPALDGLSNAVASAMFTGTNTAPVQIDSLIDFYAPGKVQ